MKKSIKKSLLITLILVNYNIYAQSIMTALNFGKKNDFHSDKLVTETTTQTTFYNSKNIEKKKDITTYNYQNKVTVENRYDENDNLKQRLTRIYDNTGVRSLARKLENWHPILGYFFEIAYHSYDSNEILNTIIEKNQNGNNIRQTDIINNEQGYPIELTIFVENQIQGKETAEYNNEKNEVTIYYFNKKSELINSETVKIDSANIQSGDIVNKFGDITKSAKYEMEIEYDKYGNWIRKIYSTITNGLLTKKSESTRKIKYRK
jgi:hypothetical protein